ncbi:lactaldehyde reductase domain protein, partial [Fusobacterium nucleatum subsp. nucleatum ATCC 23726]
IVDMEGMSIGQYVAGMGFSNVGLGIVHSMAHPLGGVYDIAHGVANALLLPIVMEYNMPVCIDKYGNIAKAMGVDITNMSKEEAAKAAIDAVRQLAIDVNIPQTLRELNIPKEGLPRLAKDALADVCTGGNPREVTYEDILKLYEIAY